jgi:hypothetical protein
MHSRQGYLPESQSPQSKRLQRHAAAQRPQVPGEGALSFKDRMPEKL